MRARVFVLSALLALAAVPAFAQNKCEVTPPTNPQLNNPHVYAFGWNGKDEDGVAVTPSTVQVEVIVDNVSKPLVPLPAPVGTPTATGCNWYVLPNQTTAKGSHNVMFALVSPDGRGAPNTPFAFGIKGKPPSAVINGQAAQQ
jgi:hypothetical protein